MSSDSPRSRRSRSAAGVTAKIERHVPPWVRDLGRDTLVAGTPADAVTYDERLNRAGLQYYIAFVYGNDLETLQLLAQEVIPELRRRQAAAGEAARQALPMT